MSKRLVVDAVLIAGLALLLGGAANLLPSRHLAWWGKGQEPPRAGVDFRLVDAFTADTLRTSLPRVVVVDTREPAAFAAGRVAGALRLSYAELGTELTAELLERLRQADAVILVGHADEGDIEQLLAQELRARGVQTSSIVVGGYPAWSESGLPVEGGQP